MIILGGIVELILGVPAEGKSLESIAEPLSSQDAATSRPPEASVRTGA